MYTILLWWSFCCLNSYLDANDSLITSMKSEEVVRDIEFCQINFPSFFFHPVNMKYFKSSSYNRC